MPRISPLTDGDPRSLGGYTLTGRLGEGGQGVVYIAEDAAGERVAIKALHGRFREDPSARARMAREVAAARQVAAFCTARLLDYDLDGDRPYIVSEFIDGPSLHDVVTREGPRTGSALDRLAIGTATALAAIHQQGIVHRDFKPANVLMGPDGPRVVDFGIAQARDLGLAPLTATGAVIGTPGFLAPEQLNGESVGPAVDVFAWGATMTFAATGRLPFNGDTFAAIVNKVLNHEPDLGDLSGVMRTIVGRCLAKNPDDRPESRDLLLHLLGHTPEPAEEPDDLLQEGTRVATMVAPPPTLSPPPMPPPPLPADPPAAAHRPPPYRPPATPPPPHDPIPAYQHAAPAPAPTPVPTPPPVIAPTRRSLKPKSLRRMTRPVIKRGRSIGSMLALGCVTLLVLTVGGCLAVIATLSSGEDAGEERGSKRPARVSVPLAYGGTWTGSFRAKGTPWEMRLTLVPGLRSGIVQYRERKGTAVCIGRVTAQRSNDTRLELTEKITSGPCPDARRIVLTKSPSGKGGKGDKDDEESAAVKLPDRLRLRLHDGARQVASATLKK